MVPSLLRRLLPGTLPMQARGATQAASADHAGQVGPTPSPDVAGGDGLRICLLSYRSNPFSGGQGVYVKYLSRELTRLGHSVDVISGRPYPDLDPQVDLVELPGPDVIEAEDRLRAFEPAFLRDPTKLFEWASVLTGGFPEPYTFGRRVVRHFERHGNPYDVVHDNQSLCYGLLELLEMGVPTVATIHHPITVDREVALREADGLVDRLLVRRWYRFLEMQRRVANRLPHVITVSRAAASTAVRDFGVSPAAIDVVHNGVDADTFRPRPDVERDPKRLMTTVSADAPLKGLPYLLRAFARVREQDPEVELVLVGEPNEGGRADRLIDELGIGADIETHSEISTERMVALYASAGLAVVPSLYEGFGLPAGEAMACGVPLVATTGGGLSEVVGDACVTVPPADVEALASAIATLLADPDRRARMGRAARERITEQFGWERAARETVGVYRRAIDGDD